ncbi:MAG: hypothetical protein ACPLYF_05765 [Fervidobacterium sp.]
MAEKVRGIGVNLFGIVLGVIEMILASFIISFATYFNMMIAEITKPTEWYTPPAYISSLLGAAGSLIMFGGVYVLVHAIKCVVDKAFMAYIASKQQTPIPPPPTQK